MPAHYLLRIGDGDHFCSSSFYAIWGVHSKVGPVKGFLKNVKQGDYLWFVKGKNKGQIIAVATFHHANQRIIGPIIDLTRTNQELGWTKTEGEWDTEIHYTHLYNLTPCELYSEIKGAATIRKYSDKCKVDLPNEYPTIVRYSTVVPNMKK